MATASIGRTSTKTSALKGCYPVRPRHGLVDRCAHSNGWLRSRCGRRAVLGAAASRRVVHALTAAEREWWTTDGRRYSTSALGLPVTVAVESG